MKKMKTKISFYQSIKSSDAEQISSSRVKTISDSKKKLTIQEKQFDEQQRKIIDNILELSEKKLPITLVTVLEKMEPFHYSQEYDIRPNTDGKTCLYINNQFSEISSEYERNIVFFIISVIDFFKYLEEKKYLISIKKDKNDEEVEHGNPDNTNAYHEYDFGSSKVDNLIDLYDSISFIPTFKLQNLKNHEYLDEEYWQRNFENRMSKQMNNLTACLCIIGTLSFLVSFSGLIINAHCNQKEELVHGFYKVQVIEKTEDQKQELVMDEGKNEEIQEDNTQQ